MGTTRGTTKGKRTLEPPSGPVSLKTLAAYLDLDPTTVSVVLNEVPGRSIPEANPGADPQGRAQIQLPA